MIASPISASCQSNTNMTTVTPASVITCWKKKIEPVAEEEADGLEVDGRPRHQLAGLVPVVEAEGQALEVRVQLVAQVVLDPERLPPGDEAPAHHAQRLHEADDQDEDDVELELAAVVGLDRLVDDRGRDQDRARSRRPARRREDHRDDQRELVGAQEPEETGERLAICEQVLRPTLTMSLTIRVVAGLACLPHARADNRSMETPDTRYAKSGDVASPTRSSGDGPFDLVFVPGYVTHLELHLEDPELRRPFLARARVVLPADPLRQARHGNVGSASAESPTLETRMDDVRAVMDAVGSRGPPSIGLSEGAADEHPVRCDVSGADRGARRLRSAMPRGMWAPDYPWGRTEEE